MNWTVTLKDIPDDQLTQALGQAHIPALMAALVHLTSSGEHLRGDIRPYVEQLAEEEDGLTENVREAARAMAVDALCSYRDKGTTS